MVGPADSSVRLGNRESTIVPDARLADQLTAAARKRAARRRLKHKLRQARDRLLTDDRFQSGDYEICPQSGRIKLTNKLGQASSRPPRQLHKRDYVTLAGIWIGCLMLIWRLYTLARSLMRGPQLELSFTVCPYDTLDSRLLAQCPAWLASKVEYVEVDPRDTIWKLCLAGVMCLLCLLPGSLHTWDAVMNRSGLSVPLI